MDNSDFFFGSDLVSSSPAQPRQAIYKLDIKEQSPEVQQLLGLTLMTTIAQNPQGKHGLHIYELDEGKTCEGCGKKHVVLNMLAFTEDQETAKRLKAAVEAEFLKIQSERSSN